MTIARGKGSKSKNKGNAGERELCALLSESLGGSFVRVPNSGAFTGGFNAARKLGLSSTQNRIYRGDIITPDHLPKMVIETKWYKDFQFHQLLSTGSCNMLDGWVEQVLTTIDPEDQWFVIFKINRLGWWVATRLDSDYTMKNFCTYASKSVRLAITNLPDFLDMNGETIKARCR